MNLKAIVIGAGWAGEGHTNALRYCGVEVADIRGEPHRPYLTFYDGWRYQEAIDAIRSGRGWYELPVLT
ncbi:MAG: hypothetical protein DCC57_20275 [Chloroflexi bacterium]|nr:MAG: hypothetical protein DCC57_20275 [Chloroflexota bacterium]